MTLISWILRAAFWLLLLLVLLLVTLRIAAWLREGEDSGASMPVDGRMIPTEMGEIFILEAGPEDGLPVLLIHGSVGWSGFWDQTLSALGEAGYRAMAFDMPPMGYSERDPEGLYDRETQGDRVLALVDALRARPILVAHSFGAGAGAEAVMRDQDAFAGFVVVAGAIGLREGDAPVAALPAPLRSGLIREVGVSATVTNPWITRRLLSLFLHQKQTATKAQADIINRPMRQAGTTQAIATWLPSLFETDPSVPSTTPKGWRGLTLPVAFLWGREDTTTPLAQGQRLAELSKGAPLTILDDLGHIPHIEAPGTFNAALIGALNQIATGE